MGLVFLVGEDFFPSVDSGQMRLHARAPAGTRIEETEARFSQIDREIREQIPPNEIDTIIDNIGVPNSFTSLAQGDIPTISSADGEILISLNKEKHGSARNYEVQLRKRLNRKFPDTTFFFQPANVFCSRFDSSSCTAGRAMHAAIRARRSSCCRRNDHVAGARDMADG